MYILQLNKNQPAMIIIVFGLPGSGKSYFAGHLRKEINAVLFNTDMIRDEIDQKGKYEERTKQLVYKEMLRKTLENLKNGSDIIVDGTFHKRDRRKDFISAAIKNKTELRLIEIRASEHTIKTRLAQKREYSEADYSVYLKLKAEFEEEYSYHLVLWSDSLPIEDMIIKAKSYIYGN